MDMKDTYPVLYEAYEHYRKTGDRCFKVLPKNPDYLLNVLNTVPSLQESGYIDNVSDNLLNDDAISLFPLEDASFDITFAGIRFIEHSRER